MSIGGQPYRGFLVIELGGDGAHPAAWRAARPAPAELLPGDRIRATVLAAESAGFHVATFAKGLQNGGGGGGTDIGGRLDAVQRAAFAGPITHSIVLVPEVDTIHTEPFHVATQLASLDYVSGGRAGCLLAPATSEEEAVLVPRTLQGQLPVVVPAGHFSGARLSGVDAVLATSPSVDRLVADVRHVKEQTKGSLAVIAELDVVLDARGQGAVERVAALDAHTPWHSARARYTGTAHGLVELLAEVLAVADGVRLHPAVVEVDLEELARFVLPELRGRGVLAPAVPETTFRELLGLEHLNITVCNGHMAGV